MAICSVCTQEVFRYTVRTGKEGSLIECTKCARGPATYQPFKAYWDSNISDNPVYIESDRQHQRLMKQNGLEVRPREHIDDLNHRRYQKGMPPLEK